MIDVVSLLFHDVYVTHPSESGFGGHAAQNYKLSIPEFEAALTALSGLQRHAVVLAPDLPVADGRALAITVDDGGVSYYTIIADRLEALGWRGHCFVSTNMIGRPGFLDGAQIRELDRRGHVIGSHSASHPTRFSACSRESMLVEWLSSRKVLEDLLGHPVEVASLPGGYFSSRVAWSAAQAGFRMLLTSEPTIRIRHVRGCRVAGRFTVRAGARSEHVRALGDFAPSAFRREWAAWNAKKVFKMVLGPVYPRVGEWLMRERSS